MFPSSAILEETFPSGGDGNEIKGRYAISAKIQFNQRKAKKKDYHQKVSGFKKSKKKKNSNPQRIGGVQAMVIPVLPFILVSRSTFCFGDQADFLRSRRIFVSEDCVLRRS